MQLLNPNPNMETFCVLSWKHPVFICSVHSEVITIWFKNFVTMWISILPLIYFIMFVITCYSAYWIWCSKITNSTVVLLHCSRHPWGHQWHTESFPAELTKPPWSWRHSCRQYPSNSLPCQTTCTYNCHYGWYNISKMPLLTSAVSTICIDWDVLKNRQTYNMTKWAIFRNIIINPEHDFNSLSEENMLQAIESITNLIQLYTEWHFF